MTKTLPISDVKTHLPALLDGVTEREDEIVVTRNGTPAAVILNKVFVDSSWGRASSKAKFALPP